MTANWGNRVKSLRDLRGWTQEDLAQRTGLSRSMISRIEIGDIKAQTPDTVEKLAQAFDMTEGEFVIYLHESKVETRSLLRAFEVPVKGTVREMIFTELKIPEFILINENVINEFRDYKDHIVAIRINDNSYEDENIEPDSYIYIRLTNEIHPGRLHAIHIGDRLIVRRVVKNGDDRFTLLSSDGRYLHTDGNLHIMGVVFYTNKGRFLR